MKAVRKSNSRAIQGALNRISRRRSNDVPKSAFAPRSVETNTKSKLLGENAWEQWDNYEDHNQFPNSPPPK